MEAAHYVAMPITASAMHETFIRSAEASRKVLAERIGASRSALAAMEKSHEQLVAQLASIDVDIESWRRRLLPVGRLSADLLSLIFELAVHGQEAAAGTDSPTEPRPQLAFTFAAVSKSWRAAALSTPRIWSNIRIDFAPRYDHHDLGLTPISHTDRWFQTLALSIERSKSAPLNVEIVNFVPDLLHQFRDYRTAFMSVLTQAHRWRSFSFHTVAIGEGDDYVALYFQRPTPWLEVFHLEVATYLGGHKPAIPVRFLPQVPRLRSLNVPADFVTSVGFTAAPALKSISLFNGPISIPKLADLLQGSPQLESINVHDVLDLDFMPAQAGAAEPRILPSLTRLDVRDGTSDLLQSWSRHISCPNLRHMTLEDQPGDTTTYALNSLCATVTHLNINLSYTYDDDDGHQTLATILRRFPRLERLELHEVSIAPSDLASLNKPTATGKWTCPGLRTLVFGDQITFSGRGIAEELLTFVRERTETDASSSTFDTRLDSVAFISVVHGTRIPLWLPEVLDDIFASARPSSISPTSSSTSEPSSSPSPHGISATSPSR